jgi:hypothetical protein
MNDLAPPNSPNVRCGIRAGSDASISCELYVGHDGSHAAVGRRRDERVLLRWRSERRLTDLVEKPFTSAQAAGLAWAPGYPLSQVIETVGLKA